MSDTREDYIAYRLKRAHEMVEEGEILWFVEHYNSYVNRLYYACFYSVSALLLRDGYSPATHAGTRNLFAQHYVKTMRVTPEMGDLYFALFHYRQESDYKDNFQINVTLAAPWLEKTVEFIETIEQLLKNTS